MLILNKVDLIDPPVLLGLAEAFNREGIFSDIFMVSALTGEGIPRLEAEIRRRLSPDAEEFRVRIPYTSPAAIAAARAAFRVLNEQDEGDALSMRLSGERRHLKPLARFVDGAH